MDPQAQTGIVVAVGSGAGYVLRQMLKWGRLGNYPVLAVDTDRYALESTYAPSRVWLTDDEGYTGLTIQLVPDEVRHATYESLDQLAAALRGYHTAIVLVCLGGATGLGATPVICTLARQLGLKTILLATLPFQFEGPVRRAIAESVLDELPPTADLAYLLDYEEFRQGQAERSTIRELFEASNAYLDEVIRRLVEAAEGFSLPQRPASQSDCSWLKVL